MITKRFCNSIIVNMKSSKATSKPGDIKLIELFSGNFEGNSSITILGRNLRRNDFEAQISRQEIENKLEKLC